MSFTTHFISSSVINVDVRTNSKVILLPASSTVQGQVIYIKDIYGSCSTNTLFVSTIGQDLLDKTTNRISLTTSYQSIRLGSFGNVDWSILQNSKVQ
jgi:hypothetical protein